MRAPLPWLPFLLSCAITGSTGMPFTHRKRIGAENTDTEQQAAETQTSQGAGVTAEVQAALRTLRKHFVLRLPALLYHMDGKHDRNALIDALWSGEFLTTRGREGRFTEKNPFLVSLFENLCDEETSAAPRRRKTIIPRFEGVISHVVRARSQKRVPIEVAVLSLVFLQYSVPHFVWNAAAQLTRAVMSMSWTVQLCEDAILRDPGPSYPTATGMTAAVFDNFMMKIGYGSYATQEFKARTFQMTNWASVFLPAQSVPAPFNIGAMLRDGGIFRSDIALSDFLDLFSPVNQYILDNKRRRWSEFLDRAVAGTLWSKEVYDSPYPPTKFHWHNPIFDRLQSSYEDVNFELDCMRKSDYHKYSDCIQIGGDGLSYMRLIHRLAQDPQQFLHTKPVIIPRLGALS